MTGGDPAVRAPAERDVRALWATYKRSGEPEAREALVAHYLPLVRKVTGRLPFAAIPQVDTEDLIGYGIVGLLDALDRFDPSRGVKFETYATTRIKGSVLDHVRAMDWVPRSLRKKARELEATYRRVESSLGRSATDEEIAQAAGMSVRELEELLSAMGRMELVSLDEQFAKGEDSDSVRVLDVFGDRASPDPVAHLEREEMVQALGRAIDDLPERERLVVTLYYYEEFPVKRIAEILGVSESRVSQLHSRAIMRLRGQLASRGLTAGGPASAHRAAGATGRSGGR